MKYTIIRQKLSQYSAKIHGGQALFTYPAVADFVENLPGFNCVLPLGRIESGERSAPREIIWHVKGDGDLVPFSELGDAEQVRLRKQVEDSLDLLRKEAGRLKTDDSKAKRDLGGILEKIESPSDEFIYLLNGKPVITGWGLTEEGPEPQMVTSESGVETGKGPEQVSKAMPMAGAVPDSVGSDKPKDKMEPPVVAPVPLPPAKGTPKWLWALLAVLLLALVAALLYWWLCRPDARKTAAVTAPGKPPLTETKPAQPLEPVKVTTTTVPAKPAPVATVQEVKQPLAETLPLPIPKGERVQVWDEHIHDYIWVPNGTVWWSDGTIIWDPVLKRYYCRDCEKRILAEHSGSTIKVGGVVQEAVKYIELSVDPPDPAAQWKITIDPESEEEVKRDPEKFIQFYRPQKGLEALGPAVRVAVMSGKTFKAIVTAVDSKGKRSFHEIEVTRQGR